MRGVRPVIVTLSAAAIALSAPAAVIAGVSTAEAETVTVTVKATQSSVSGSRNHALLDAVNKARRHGRYCGSRYYPAVGKLQFDTRLHDAAEVHARDMAKKDYFDHISKGSGYTPSSRARSEGFRRGVGENIAAGYLNVDAVMKGWLKSDGHCANIMSKPYAEVGFGIAYRSSSTYRMYWVQDFGLKH